MFKLLKSLSLRQFQVRPVRSLLIAFGIALGVTLFTSINLINQSTLAMLRENVESITGKASITVTAGESGFDEKYVETIQATEGVSHAAPMVEMRAFFTKENGDPETLIVMGIDLLKESSIRTYKTEDGEVIEDPLVFLNQPDSIILTKSFAKNYGFKIDDKISLTSSKGKQFFTVRGLLSPSGAAKAYGGSIAFMDIDGARMTFGKESKVDRVDIITKSDFTTEQVITNLRKQLPGSFKVELPEAQVVTLQKMVQSYQGLLSFMSSLALVVAIFLVSNTTAITVAERRREIGSLRALGAKRSQILTLILTETATVGAISSLAGAFFGYLFAQRIVHSVAEAMTSQYLMKFQAPELVFGAHDVLLAVLIGILSTVLAASFPAYHAMKIQPIEALKPKGTITETAAKTTSGSTVIFVIGATILSFLAFSSYFKLGTEIPLIDQLSPLLGILGSILVTPKLSFLGLRLLTNFGISNSTISSRLAQENLMVNSRRTAGNVLSLMVGLLLVILISALNHSFRISLQKWSAKVVSYGPLYVSSNGRLSDFQVQLMHESFSNELKTTEGLDTSVDNPVLGFRYLKVDYQGRMIGLKAFDKPPEKYGYDFIDSVSEPSSKIGKKFFEDAGVVLVSEIFAKNFKVKIGDSVRLPTGTGFHEYRIIGLMREYASPEGVIYINRKIYSRDWNDPLCTAFSLLPAPGYSLDTLKKNVDAKFGISHQIIVTEANKIVDDILKMIEQNFSITRSVEFAALVVGLLGLLNTMMVSVLERTREIGVLRAVGMSRTQLFRMILSEALIQGMFGVLIALGLGIFLAYLWVYSILAGVLGWSIDFYFPVQSALMAFVLGIAVSMIAGILPALRSSRLEIRTALDYE